MKTKVNLKQLVRARFFVDKKNVYDKVITLEDYEDQKALFNRIYTERNDRYYWAEPLQIRE